MPLKQPFIADREMISTDAKYADIYDKWFILALLYFFILVFIHSPMSIPYY